MPNSIFQTCPVSCRSFSVKETVPFSCYILDRSKLIWVDQKTFEFVISWVTFDKLKSKFVYQRYVFSKYAELSKLVGCFQSLLLDRLL